VIVVDANILIYAYNEHVPQHQRARNWLESALSGSERIGLPWAVTHAFLRVTTNHRILPVPLTTDVATGIVDEWLEQPIVRVIDAGPLYWPIFRHLLGGAGIRGNVLMDAHIAALALENRADICTADRDFHRFAGLRVHNPLA
jgi:toxin-antitoxin system PIN domain toxin